MDTGPQEVDDPAMLFDLTQLALAAVVSVVWVRHLQRAALESQPVS